MIVAAIPFGVLAICIARAIYTQIAVIINTYYTGKLYGLGYFEQVADFIKYLLFSFVAVTPAFVLSFTAIPPILVLLIGGTSACAIYWFLLRKDSNLLELVMLCKSHLSGK